MQALLASIADVLDKVADVDAILQGDRVGLLDSWAIGDWVGERNTELNNVWYEVLDERLWSSIVASEFYVPAPPAWRPSMISTHDSPVGKPAVKYATKADYIHISFTSVYFTMMSPTLPSFLHCANVCFNPSILFDNYGLVTVGYFLLSSEPLSRMSSIIFPNSRDTVYGYMVV